MQRHLRQGRWQEPELDERQRQLPMKNVKFSRSKKSESEKESQSYKTLKIYLNVPENEWTRTKCFRIFFEN